MELKANPPTVRAWLQASVPLAAVLAPMATVWSSNFGTPPVQAEAASHEPIAAVPLKVIVPLTAGF